MIVVSRNIRYIRDIREGSLGRGVKRLCVVEEPPIYLCPCIVESVFSVCHSGRCAKPVERTREMSDVR